MKELLTSLLLWISAHSGYGVPPDLPEIQFKSRAEIISIVYGEKAIENQDRQIDGTYDYQTNTICLRNDWNPRKKENHGALLHELVHFLQYKNGLRFTTASEKCLAESIAYTLQIKWYEENNIPSPFDPLFILLIDLCGKGVQQ